jgi:N-dimethylarginine dimethylaminohydrolase
MPATGQLLTDPAAIPDVEAFDSHPPRSSVLFSTPTHFTVNYRINPYMETGVDSERALAQWETLVETYEDLADVSVLDVEAVHDRMANGTAPPEQLPDIAFCSNLALPLAGGERFVLAQMATEQRRGEPAYFEQWADERGLTVERLHTDAAFEGCGDARWHPGRELLWGGHGQRTEIGAYEELAERFDVPVVPLELTDEAYYHLDVCFSALDETTAVVCPDAFTDAGRRKLEAVFETLIEVSPAAAQEEFACNCHSVDGERVVIDERNAATADRLAEHGFETVPVATDEFIKAGGSVACLAFPI